MTRFVITGKVSNPLAGSSLNEDLVISGRLDSKLAQLNLEVEKIETAGEDVTYYLKESKGPKLMCD